MHPSLVYNLRWSLLLLVVLIAGLSLILVGWQRRLKQSRPVAEDAVSMAATQTAAPEETELPPEETQEPETTEAPAAETPAEPAAESTKEEKKEEDE